MRETSLGHVRGNPKHLSPIWVIKVKTEAKGRHRYKIRRVTWEKRGTYNHVSMTNTPMEMTIAREDIAMMSQPTTGV